jgi:uncharacterized protein (TIGR03382 family)
VNTTAGSVDLHIQANSPAVNLAVGSPVTVDIDGDARPANSAPDAGADEFTGTVTFQIVAPTAMPNGTVGVVYSTEISATGGSAPFTWSISSGNLPPGLSLGTLSTINSTAVTGTPTSSGSFSFVVRLEDSNNQSVTRNYSITVVSGAGRSSGSSSSGGCASLETGGAIALVLGAAMLALATRRRRKLGVVRSRR